MHLNIFQTFEKEGRKFPLSALNGTEWHEEMWLKGPPHGTNYISSSGDAAEDDAPTIMNWINCKPQHAFIY